MFSENHRDSCTYLMERPVISLPEGVVKTTPNQPQKTCFVSARTQQRLEYEDAYRKERLKVLSSRRNKSRSTSFNEAARDAEDQLQLFWQILAQLARRENACLQRDGIGEEREKIRLETMEVLQTIL